MKLFQESDDEHWVHSKYATSASDQYEKQPLNPSINEQSVPLTDAIIVALSKLVDDAQADNRREPSHSEIQTQIDRAGLSACDPNQQGQTIGKAKRVRAVLNWAIENNIPAGARFVHGLLGHIRGCGGFRKGSPNFVGPDVLRSAVSAFSTEGLVLGSDGVLAPRVLDGMSGIQLTEALSSYVRRAKKGVTDAALLAGTSKDLLEATAAHVLTTRYGRYSTGHIFPTLLGQAFVALDISVPNDGKGDTPINRLDRSLFEAACAINTMRNREGTGHGRPWPTNMNDELARTAVEMMGIVAERMLNALRQVK